MLVTIAAILIILHPGPQTRLRPVFEADALAPRKWSDVTGRE